MSISKKQTVINVEHLTFERNHEQIIHDFSFEINEGDYVGVIGPNGGGKTTLLRLLLGIIKPTAGKIEMLGGNPLDKNVRKKIGYVAQRGGNLDAQFPATVDEVIRSGRTPKLGIFGSFKSKDKKIINRIVKELEIEKLLFRSVSKLSGGERQKVLLARALVGEPKMLFLDEPVDGLDPNSRDHFYRILKKLNRSGMTILFVSHDVHSVSKEARSAICLKHQLVCHGKKACVIGTESLRDLFHPDMEDLRHHHDT